jgi:hypothetical protein
MIPKKWDVKLVSQWVPTNVGSQAGMGNVVPSLSPGGLGKRGVSTVSTVFCGT